MNDFDSDALKIKVKICVKSQEQHNKMDTAHQTPYLHLYEVKIVLYIDVKKTIMIRFREPFRT